MPDEKGELTTGEKLAVAHVGCVGVGCTIVIVLVAAFVIWATWDVL